MEFTVEEALRRGVAAIHEGRLQDAECVYRDILHSQPGHPDANRNLFVSAAFEDKVAAALPLFNAALNANPEVEHFCLSYIEALIKERSFDDAKKALGQLKKVGGDEGKLSVLKLQLLRKIASSSNSSASPPQERLSRLLEHYQHERLIEAEILALKIIQDFPVHQFAWKVLGAVMGATNRNSEAADVNRTAVALAPQDAEAHCNLGVTLKALGRLQEAEASYLQAITLKPDYAEAHSNLGATYQELGRLRKAEASYSQAIMLEPGLVAAHYNLGNTLKELGRCAEAEASYERAILLRPDYAPAHSNLGVVLKAQGRLEEAEASYNHALALMPDVAEIHYNLGVTLKESDRLVEAEASFNQAIALRHNYSEAHCSLGSTLQALGRLDEAEASYAIAIVLKPDYAEAHAHLGAMYQELGWLEKALESFSKAIAVKPGWAEAHLYLANALHKRGQVSDAEASYKKAIALKPDFAEAQNNLGVALQELGRLTEAERSFEKALVSKPGYAEAHNNLGNTLRELGRIDEAEACYSRAITLKAGYADAHGNLGMLFFECGKYSEAVKHFEVSGTRASKLRATQCWYLLDEKARFYREYDLLVSQGENNAVIGSLGVRSALKFGTKPTNPFCSKPLNYVVHTDLHSECDFEKTFSESVRNILTGDAVSYRAQDLITNGMQTAGNVFAQGQVPETEIENIIRAEIEKYRIRFKGSEEGFIKSWPTSYELRGWLVSMQSGGSLAPHMHDSGWVSGSVYINVPPKSTPQSGNLVLSLSDDETCLECEKGGQRIVDVERGSLCLFPSSLLHCTVPFEEKQSRVVLAFDVIPKS